MGLTEGEMSMNSFVAISVDGCDFGLDDIEETKVFLHCSFDDRLVIMVHFE